jgi:hypothetical protein
MTAELKERDLYQYTLKREKEIRAAEETTGYVVRYNSLFATFRIGARRRY